MALPDVTLTLTSKGEEEEEEEEVDLHFWLLGGLGLSRLGCTNQSPSAL